MTDNFYLGLANELSAKLRRVSAFIEHAPSVGAYHEEVLKAILRSILPSRFSVKTGFAYNAEVGSSQQGDILIIDESHPGAYHFKEGEFAIALPEAIVCVIEVKTKLTKRTFQEAMKALYSFRKVGAAIHPITFLFAYESQPFKDTTLESWYEPINEVPNEIQNYPWAVYALNRGIIIHRKISDVEFGHNILEGDVSRGPKLKSLSIFLQTVKKCLFLYSGEKLNPYEYAEMEGISAQNILYQFGPQASDS